MLIIINWKTYLNDNFANKKQFFIFIISEANKLAKRSIENLTNKGSNGNNSAGQSGGQSTNKNNNNNNNTATNGTQKKKKTRFLLIILIILVTLCKFF